jgi:putative spermidine/putrescine transport system ATP-binding protein
MIAATSEFVRVERVTKTYGRSAALADVSFGIRRGEFLTLLGPSGSGKTTMLMLLAGFEAPTDGRLMLDGRDITPVPAEARNFGMVFQGYALFPHMTIAENVAYPLMIRKRSKAERRRAAGEMLERVGLSGLGDRMPAQLSGGQQQRVALARSLVFKPDMLLLDEPLSALDRSLRVELQAELRRIHQEVGTTFVFVTHDQGEALSLSDRIAVLSQGRLEQIATPTALYDAPANRFVAGFLGAANFLPVEVLADERRGETSRCRIGDRLVSCRTSAGSARSGRAMLTVRPERVAVTLAAPQADLNALPVTFLDSTYLGSHVDALLETPGSIRMTARLPASTVAGLQRGQACWAVWRAEDGFLIDSNHDADG